MNPRRENPVGGLGASSESFFELTRHLPFVRAHFDKRLDKRLDECRLRIYYIKKQRGRGWGGWRFQDYLVGQVV